MREPRAIAACLRRPARSRSACPPGSASSACPITRSTLVEAADYSHVFDPAGPSPSLFYPGVALGPWSCLLSHPRFVRVCHRLGLCRYWQETGQWPDCAAWVPFDFKSAVRRAIASGPAPGDKAAQAVRQGVWP
jgi:hypothetical protein